LTDAGNKVVVGRITDATGIPSPFWQSFNECCICKSITSNNDGKSIASSCCQWSFEIDCILLQLLLSGASSETSDAEYAWTTVTECFLWCNY
jgi:hypothetical protein